MSGKSVLIFGSGYITKSVLSYFLRFPEFTVTVVSHDAGSLKQLETEYKKNVKYVFSDIENKKTIIEAMKDCNLVISLLPPPLHPKVAELCLDLNKHLVTASYLSPAIIEFQEKAKAKGLVFLFEVGLDPGIDHIATLKIVEEIRKKNGKIKNFYSFCGGLVSSDCVDNPLGYKFTWSPVGVFKALYNDALFLENGKVVNVKAKDLLYSAREYKVNNALNIVYYPNRDSTKYKELYRINEAQTVLRGTFRYKGYCEIIAAFQELGYLSDRITNYKNWVDFTNNCVSNSNLNRSILNEKDVAFLQQRFQGIDYSKLKFTKILGCITSHPLWSQLSKKAVLDRAAMIMDGLEFFGFLNEKFKLNPNRTVLENFVETLKPYLTMSESQTDSIMMSIKFDVEYPSGISEEILFQFIMNGEKNGHSAMTKAVGVPTAIGAKLILDGKIKQTGVFGPFTEDVYNPLFDEMVKEKLISNYTTKQFKPKL